MLNVSLIVPDSPGSTRTEATVSVLLPVDVELPEATLVNPVVVMVTLSPLLPLTHVFFKVSLAGIAISNMPRPWVAMRRTRLTF